MKRIALIFAAVTLGLSAPAAAHAQGRGKGQDRDRDRGEEAAPRPPRAESPERQAPPRQPPPPQQRVISMGQAIATVERQVPGRFLDGGLEDRGGRPVYRIRWAAENGQRMDFIVDAVTGAMSR